MLKVIVDVTPMTAKPSGVGLYVANLITQLGLIKSSSISRPTKAGFVDGGSAELSPLDLRLFYQPGLKNWLRRDTSYPESLPGDLERYFFPYPVRISNWFINNYPQIFAKLLDPEFAKYQIFHGTNFSVYPDSHTFKVMTLYDLTFLRYPQYVDQVVAKYFKRVRQCLQWTDLIVAISESTKQDAIKYLGISPEKIFVTPLASRYTPQYFQDQKIDIDILKAESNYNFEIPYLLFVSTIEPRKNIIALIEAFNHLKQQQKIAHNLVLIGKKGWLYEDIFKAIANSPFRDSIYHLDYLSDQLVALFYKLATVFVYPSHYEGFGLPVLEAMNLGTPVVCSNTSSLPEVVGDAALMVAPDQPLELAEAILRVIESEELRQSLVRKGYQQALRFSWEKTTVKTLEAYLSLFA